jgi:nucleotide-binding universal stress UspA family protein
MSGFERILVPTDMSDAAEPALRYALQLHDTLGSRITLLHAHPMPLYPDQPLGYYIENATDARLDAAERLRDYARAKVPRGVTVATTVIDDLPARAIVETADNVDADLIVMTPGATTERVRRTTSRPVVSAPAALDR